MYDFAVIGGGIVGLSVAWQLRQRRPSGSIVVIEKEQAVAQHQTGHNSGVIHAGIYYEPGSLKADLCRKGVAATLRFCKDNGIRYEQCGKLIVATSPAEHERMLALHERALRNGIEVELLGESQLRDIEPSVAGIGAILSPTTGIVDYTEVAGAMAHRLEELGGEILTGTPVTALEETSDAVILHRGDLPPIETRNLVVCGGLMADRLAAMMNLEIDFRVVPYRGEYYQLPAEKSEIVRHLIYPVPDPGLPFLGVHLTRMIDGTVTVGPNAVQGWKREGYGRVNFSARDTMEMLGFPGFWRVTADNLAVGLAEFWNSIWKPGYLKQVQKYCPSVRLSDLQPYPAGIRAQAVMRDGTLVHDFLFAETARSLHVCNAPSPAATSAIPIGELICDKVLDKVPQS
ncbi:MAG: L-2-hydroxyglutarate oxidase [Gammaproteobacteria bacterium]|jgi:L-2-hydroxyglutarate oxidase|nr:L-2-hydroxyglutarate oxidase [Gammaproteobacteria bacterium]